MARFKGEMWFAWFPVRTNGGWRWLEWVFRDHATFEDGTMRFRYHAMP